jgi:hypothetical protein
MNQLNKQTFRHKTTVTEQKDEKKYFLFKTDYFEMKWNVEGLRIYGEKLQKLVDTRKNWAGQLYSQIARKIKYISVKGVPLDVTKIDYEETIITFADEVKKKVKLREVPIQKTIEETTKPKKNWHPTKYALGGDRA